MDDSGCEKDSCIRSQHIAHTCKGHQGRADEGYLVLGDFVGKITDKWPAEQGAQVHGTAHETHDRRCSSQTFREPCNQGRHHHGTGHKEKTGSQDQHNISG